ncbi:MAG: hypothetical protein QME51_03325 [Planctomycetota bacterium]|nr:hypothetical protein [Planctomycetota bacterium]MDI6787381.1 hypothetical protein [Planctomycetota bacterium]
MTETIHSKIIARLSNLVNYYYKNSVLINLTNTDGCAIISCRIMVARKLRNHPESIRGDKTITYEQISCFIQIRSERLV